MAYEKRVCVLKQIKKGFSADGSALSGAGLRVEVTYSSSNSVAKGNVINQSRTGSAKKGDTVTIDVSTGPETPSGGGGESTE